MSVPRSALCRYWMPLLILLLATPGLTLASRFTPLEWQQRVEKHAVPQIMGQRKHINWIRDQNRNFIDDEIESRFSSGETVDVVVAFNTCKTPREERSLLSAFGRVSYQSKLITYAMLEDVRVDDLPRLAALPEVAMIEWQVRGQVMLDVSTRSVQARASATFSPDTAEDDNISGNGVNIAIMDTGVDDAGHPAFAGKRVAGFNSLIFEDFNGNGVDDSCEPAPTGNGVCTDADDEPADGSTDPDDGHSHGSHVAGIALAAAVAGETCSAPDDGSGTNCMGNAPDAGLVDVQICDQWGSCSQLNVAEGLDWIGLNADTFDIRVVNMSIGFCTDDDGTSAMAQQASYLSALGIVVTIAHGNAGNCALVPGTVRTMFPGSATFAITVGAVNDRNTIARGDDTNYSSFLRGPRNDFNTAAPNLLALKPDLSAPGEFIISANDGPGFGYISKSGTSMAAPHVAGAAALILEDRSEIDPGSLKDLLKRTADTTLNAAAYPAVDADWDDALGSGMLNVWDALEVVEDADVGFPSCTGPPSAPGKPCALASEPAWNNHMDIGRATAPKVGVANTLTAQVRNDSGMAATVRVNFGVYVFGTGNNQFFHIGTQEVTIPANTTQAVNQDWTPADSDHQCIQVNIDYGLDTDFDNNVTQRNLQVAPSVYNVRVENPFMAPAIFRVDAKSRREGWACRVDDREFKLHHFLDCPRTIKVVFDPPEGAEPGDTADCDVGVWATPEGADEPELIGGVTVRTFVPKSCRMVGQVIGKRGEFLKGVRLTFSRFSRDPGKGASSGKPVEETTTDEDGIFSVSLQHSLRYEVVIEHRQYGKHRIVVRPPCCVGALTFVLTEGGVELAGDCDGRSDYERDLASKRK